MSAWETVLQRPEGLTDADHLDWFTTVARRLLAGPCLMVQGQPHRFAEIEFYYTSDTHPDPFSHCDPLQLTCGRWYFHRTRGTYRSGSFKGVDLSFGNGKHHGGILIRGIIQPNGELIDGPSLCVDYLLKTTKAKDIAALDGWIAGRSAWNPDSPVHLTDPPGGDPTHLVPSARVGLSLKRSKDSEAPAHYLMRPYRFLSEPRLTAKGKPHMVLGLHLRGSSPEEIRQLTGCPAASIQRYVAACEEGRQQADFVPYRGIDLTPVDVCKLHGVWQAVSGAPRSS